MQKCLSAATILLCFTLTACSTSGWQPVAPRYKSDYPAFGYTVVNPQARTELWGPADGSQIWGLGPNGAILHYIAHTKQWESETGDLKEVTAIFGTSDGSQVWVAGHVYVSIGDKYASREIKVFHYTATNRRWESQPIDSEDDIESIFGTPDGSQLWAIARVPDTFVTRILHYTAESGRWQTQTTTQIELTSIYVTSDASQMWVVGEQGSLLRSTNHGETWEPHLSGTEDALHSIFGTNNGSQLWVAGANGTILHYESGHWERQTSGTDKGLFSVFGTSDGSQLWTVGLDGTILHYSQKSAGWERQESGTSKNLFHIFGTSDGSQLWVRGEDETELFYDGKSGNWEQQPNTAADENLESIFGLSDGSQLWAVGFRGTIIHYAAQTGRWEQQESGITDDLFSIFGTTDGSELWAVGRSGTILHYSVQTRVWKAQTSGTKEWLLSVFGTGDGSQLWAVGWEGTILHYSAQTGVWNSQTIGAHDDYRSIFCTKDGSQAWVVGEKRPTTAEERNRTVQKGIILHYTSETGRWEPQTSDKPFFSLFSIFGASDGSEVWAGGESALHYTSRSGRWEVQQHLYLNHLFGKGDGSQFWAADGSDVLHYTTQSGHWHQSAIVSRETVHSVFATADGSQLWAVGDKGVILQALRNQAPYIDGVEMLPVLGKAELRVRLHEPDRGWPVGMSISGARASTFEERGEDALIRLKFDPKFPVKTNSYWSFQFAPNKIDIDSGTRTHLQIELIQGQYRETYDAELTYDPLLYRILREYPMYSILSACVVTLIASLALLLLIRPIWIIYLYRKVKIYSLVEQIEIPGIGKLLQFLLKFTVLPWFVTHPRTLRAWVEANRREAAAAWALAVKAPTTMETRTSDVDIPYVALPVELKDVSSRFLSQPTAKDFEALFHEERSVVQIVGIGGVGKTTLAKRIGDLALAGGQPGAFNNCRLPIWIDEDFTDLRAVVKRIINSWYKSGEEIEEPILNALLENGLLLVMVDRVSERLPATQDYLARIHGSVRCNALIVTTRKPLPIQVPEQRYVFPQALDSSKLLNFMTEIIKYYFRDATVGEDQPFSSTRSQLELGKRLADLIEVRIGSGPESREIPMLPLPVVLFVSNAVALVTEGKSLENLPKSLPTVYANYLRRINPKISGVENSISDEDMLTGAKVLARLALGSDYIPKEFTRDRGLECLRSGAPNLPQGVDSLRRLVANGVLMSKEIGATTFHRFSLDPVAEFLAAEAHFDGCQSDGECLNKLLEESRSAQGFNNAFLLTMQARQLGRWSSSVEAGDLNTIP